MFILGEFSSIPNIRTFSIMHAPLPKWWVGVVPSPFSQSNVVCTPNWQTNGMSAAHHLFQPVSVSLAHTHTICPINCCSLCQRNICKLNYYYRAVSCEELSPAFYMCKKGIVCLRHCSERVPAWDDWLGEGHGGVLRALMSGNYVSA